MKKTIQVFLTLSLVLTMAFASPMQILAAEEGNTVLVMKGREQSVDHEIEIDVMVEEIRACPVCCFLWNTIRPYLP